MEVDGGIEVTQADMKIKATRCHQCNKDLTDLSGGTGNMTHDGKPWCGCAGNRRVNNRSPNFRGSNDELFLVRCFACGGDRGTENHVSMVASGQCAFCGWKELRGDA